MYLFNAVFINADLLISRIEILNIIANTYNDMHGKRVYTNVKLVFFNPPTFVGWGIRARTYFIQFSFVSKL